jgi:hypothetical protein
MQRDRWFVPTSSDRCSLVVVIATLLFAVAFLPALAADEGSESVGEAAVAPRQEALPTEALSCEGTNWLALDDPAQGAMIECSYCDQEYCGCIPLPECVLVYSCSCSPLQCTRSCKHKDCVY